VVCFYHNKTKASLKWKEFITARVLVLRSRLAAWKEFLCASSTLLHKTNRCQILFPSSTLQVSIGISYALKAMHVNPFHGLPCLRLEKGEKVMYCYSVNINQIILGFTRSTLSLTWKTTNIIKKVSENGFDTFSRAPKDEEKDIVALISTLMGKFLHSSLTELTIFSIQHWLERI
jgi:hypothetical protein